MANDTQAPVGGTAVHQPEPARDKKRDVLLGVVLLIVLIAIVAGVVLGWRWHDRHSQASAHVSTAELNAALAEAHAAGQPAANENAYPKALADLKTVAKGATTKTQKIKLYNALALAYEGNGQPRQAVQYYVLKHQLDPSSAGVDASSLAGIYQQLGEKSQAIAQYQLAISYVKSQHLTAGAQQSLLENYQGIINYLEGQQ